ncbi:hypothetical protein GORBP_074_00340 [Gordonia rubripertincta NBRC 101908]|uniref:Uncharacterized protein n=1 Tax=Gordonia rubripertincta NBRC 101908 TaxID=1077975 RepID=A0ABQ0HVY5_GORRU|nr:hypothetical protein GORBP_074_00340 [Gordonia rubripertincta NBRC 101908]
MGGKALRCAGLVGTMGAGPGTLTRAASVPAPCAGVAVGRDVTVESSATDMGTIIATDAVRCQSA